MLVNSPSTSYISAMGRDERETILAGVREVVATFPERVDLPYVTEVYVGQLAGAKP